jgi:hypothetical protein
VPEYRQFRRIELSRGLFAINVKGSARRINMTIEASIVSVGH